MVSRLISQMEKEAQRKVPLSSGQDDIMSE